MARRLPLSSLRVFEAAARLASFRAAAQELNLTPGAISHAIKDLEQELGVVLFTRERRRVLPTPEGETLLPHVARAFSDLQRGLDAVCLTGPQSLRLHCAPSFAGQWLVPRLAGLFEAYPALDLRLSADPNYPHFPSDLFDADIIYGDPRQAGLTVISLGPDQIAPMCAPSLVGRIHAPVDGIGVALDSVRLAERELRDGRLVMPLAGRSQTMTLVGHRLVFPAGADRKPALAKFASWLMAELELEG